MSWAVFYLIVSALLTLVLVLIAAPWFIRRQHAKADYLSNTQIIRQRLSELEREYSEGLISDADKAQAEQELKLALVDESAFVSERRKGARGPLITGAVLAIAAGVAVYASVSHLPQLKRAQDAIDNLPTLSERLARGDMASFTQQDVADLTLAIRQRLRQQPEDDRGWMYLGRLMMSLGQDAQALDAIERAVKLAPQSRENRITLAQMLMSSGEAAQLTRAQSILADSLKQTPQNDNLALMMAVVSAQLGDLATTQQYFGQVKDKLPADGTVANNLRNRIATLTARAQGAPTPDSGEAATGFSITVTAGDKARDAMPDTGYLIVFAQDADSDNRMPAAVIKIPLPDLPSTVQLSTDNAMMPQYTLQELKNVRIVARVSLDGDVAAAEGEWQGEVTEQVRPGEMPALTITINEELL
ncbi:c-type cytochrome biogenesis protein CcmI [Alteromonas halophila]|uniref:C-type cytochrome biogenesis protein CcmI n=1 Tax=Alteromonas halophila TaxID=516698 RepID=A0A918MUT7_9ALTE|nr:c-type cytochrome biogenesis protein CcmI [Alteromonas halophila]GGW72878.1 c-type cytochrome biogenesis protein CcmI [Alteromonas halophila]